MRRSISLNGLRAADALFPKSPDLIFTSDDGLLGSFVLTTMVLVLRAREVAGKEIDISTSVTDDDMSNLKTPASLVEVILRQVA